MEDATLDNIDSKDYTYKGSNLHQDTPPSQHSPDSDYQPTPSLDGNGNTSRNNPTGDHGTSRGPPAVTIGNKGSAKNIDDTMEWNLSDNLVPLQDNKCIKFLADFVMRFMTVHKIKSDISQAGIISMIEGAGLDYWGILAAISKETDPMTYVSSKKAFYIQNKIANYVGEFHHQPYSPGATQ
jgi:hypothetical protein